MFSKLSFLLILILNFFGILVAQNSKNSLQEDIKNSDYIFTGRVISKQKLRLNDTIRDKPYMIREKGRDSIDISEYLILKDKIYKGTISSDTIKLYSYSSKNDGGVDLNLNQNYIIYSIGYEHAILDSDASFYEPRLDLNSYWTDKSYWTCIKTEPKLERLIKSL